MATPDKVQAVQKVTETLKDVERVAPNKDQFDSLMNASTAIQPTTLDHSDIKPFALEDTNPEIKPVFGEENVSSQKSGSSTDQERRGQKQPEDEIEEIDGVQKSSSKSDSLINEVASLNQNGTTIASPENIQTQAKDIIHQLENVKTTLANSQADIKPSYQTLLKNRLTHIDDNLKIALNKAGVEYTPPPATTKTASNPIHTFIGFVSNSQHQLENLNGMIGQLQSATNITPANMLAIQIKMGYIQQQIELFTSLLNKALESTKTIMNVQV